MGLDCDGGAPMIVRPARRDDLSRVAEIYAHYVLHSAVTFDLEAPSAADWADKLDVVGERRLPFVVAAAADRVTGFAYAAPWRTKPAYRHSAEVSVYLQPDATGRGVGTRLLAAVIEAARHSDVHLLIAVIADTGAPAASLGLHRSAGFIEAGRLHEVGFKHGTWWDTILLEHSLAGSDARPA